MLIAIDIGNTNIKIGSFLNNKLQEISFVKDINSFPYSSFTSSEDFAISSVVPAKTKLISDRVKEIFNKEPFILSQKINYNLKIDYETPQTLGVDRIASAEGAFYLFKETVEYVTYDNKTIIITIDFGTATTLNVIKYPGVFTGGIISPGIDLMFNFLNSGTAQLPPVVADDYKNIIGNSTKSSIASGVINSNIGLIEKILAYFKTDKEIKTIIYITGGNAKKMIPFLKFDFVFEEGLVLYGINALYNLNNNIS